MGTRSLTFIKEDGEKLVCMYRQFDGYPSGHGLELAEFLKDMVVVNGYRTDDKRKIANGMGCLAAQMVAHFKTVGDPGGFYLLSTKTKDAGQEYEYTVSTKISGEGFDRTPGPLTVTVKECYAPKKTIFEGSTDEFLEFCKKSGD